MKTEEFFCIALAQIDNIAAEPPGPYELVVRSANIYAQHTKDHKIGDVHLLEYYKLWDRPRFTTAQWLELWNNIAQLKKDGVL